MDYPNFIITKQKEKSISVQRVNKYYKYLYIVFSLNLHCKGFITFDKTIHFKSRKIMSLVYSYLSGSSDSSLSPTKVKNQETPARVSQL